MFGFYHCFLFLLLLITDPYMRTLIINNFGTLYKPLNIILNSKVILGRYFLMINYRIKININVYFKDTSVS